MKFARKQLLDSILTVVLALLVLVPGLAHAAPELRPIEFWGSARMPTEQVWQGRGAVTIGKVKLLVDSSNKTPITELGFSILVTTQTDVEPWKVLSKLVLSYQKTEISKLDLTDEDLWLTARVPGNVTRYILKPSATGISIPMNKFSDIDVILTLNKKFRLKEQYGPTFSFGIYDQTFYAYDAKGNQYVTAYSEESVMPYSDEIYSNVKGIREFFGVAVNRFSNSERKRLLNEEKVSLGYVGRTVYLLKASFIEQYDSYGYTNGSKIQAKNAIGYVKERRRNGQLDVDFLAGADGLVDPSLISFKPVK